MVTITANGYQGIKGDVAKSNEYGAWVTVNRKGIDLAPRTIFFNWDAIKGGKPAEAAKPAEIPLTVTLVRKGKYTREYRMSGTHDGQSYNGELIRTSKTTDYTHMSITRFISTQTYDHKAHTYTEHEARAAEVITFHKSLNAALKGNNDVDAIRKLGVKVIGITEAA